MAVKGGVAPTASTWATCVFALTCSSLIYQGQQSRAVPGHCFYIFGEIMYGGHITDFFDRRTNNTYLARHPNESVVINRGDLAPGLQSPDSTAFDYNAYNNLINKSLPSESPHYLWPTS